MAHSLQDFGAPIPLVMRGISADAVRALPRREWPKRLYRVSLYRNATYLIFGLGVSAPMAAVFWIVAARSYSPSQVGLTSALIAAMMLLASLSNLGLNIGLVRFLAEAEKKQQLIKVSLTIGSLAALSLAAAFVAGLDLWAPDLSFMRNKAPLVIGFFVFTIASVLVVLQQSVCVAYRRSELTTAQNVVSGTPRMFLPILMVPVGVSGLFFSWGIGTVLAVVVGFWFVSRLLPDFRPLPSIQTKVIDSSMLRFSLLNCVAANLVTLPAFLLPLLIVNILNPEETAYFRIAWVVSSILFFSIPMAIGTSLLAEGANEPQKLRENTMRALKLMVAIVVPGTIVLLAFGDKILLFFGTEYSKEAANLVRILALSAIPALAIELYLTIHIVRRRMTPVVLIYGMVAFLTLGTSVVLMPVIGVTGAAISWTLTQAFVATVITLIVLKNQNEILR